MLKKANRVSKKTLDEVFKSGRFINSPALTLKYAQSGEAEPRISFIVPKNVAKSAVVRNALRRRGYQAIVGHLATLPQGFIGAFIFKKELNIDELKHELENLLNKIN